MSITDEIRGLEERMRQAELGPDPDFFEAHIADEAVIDGQMAKSKIVDAHRPGQGPKFTRVERSDLKIIPYDTAAVVTCTGSG